MSSKGHFCFKIYNMLLRLKKYKNHKYQKGFTLLELMVVVAVIGALSTLVLTQLNVARTKSRDTKRVSDISMLSVALELYFEDNGTYPTNGPYHASQPLSQYIVRLPRDPSDNAQYGYSHTGIDTGVPHLGYMIWVELERGSRSLMSDDDVDMSDFSNHSAGRLANPPPNANDPNTERCPDSNLANYNCIYNRGHNVP